ncbi:nickel pincer cofactor biosynthesis protein LarC [Chloroflexia bacterium SDU3-3]|nr:nickel pincer cofactor biosynthesis protein LarC [Chloroflexia bacterium SDU3-3]
MPKALYFDCFSGISGDMALGALLDTGLALEALREALASLPVAGWAIDAERGMRGYLSGTRALVTAPEQHVHRHLADVRAIIEGSQLSQAVKERSVAIFTLLAEAEGAIHGIAPTEVHFHEVGALDAIVDIVGVVTGLHLLGIEAVYASPVPLGTGWGRAAHGALPIPAPATLSLLAAAKAPTTADTTPFELVTPTGAALLAGLARFERPAMRLERVGYGLGKRDLERPNALRVWVGEIDAPSDHEHHDHEHHDHEHHDHEHRESREEEARTVLLETNVDNQNPEQLAYLGSLLLDLGALDVWQTAIHMKKGRLATMVSALVPAACEEQAVDALMRESTTLGVRRRAVERHTCERRVEHVDTPFGAVRVKRKLWQGRDLGAAPEFEDCARIAREQGIALRDVYALAAQLVGQASPAS